MPRGHMSPILSLSGTVAGSMGDGCVEGGCGCVLGGGFLVYLPISSLMGSSGGKQVASSRASATMSSTVFPTCLVIHCDEVARNSAFFSFLARFFAALEGGIVGPVGGTLVLGSGEEMSFMSARYLCARGLGWRWGSVYMHYEKGMRNV